MAVAVAAGGAGKPHSSTRTRFLLAKSPRPTKGTVKLGHSGPIRPQDVGNAVRSSPCAFYLFIRAHRIGAHGSPLASVSSFFAKGCVHITNSKQHKHLAASCDLLFCGRQPSVECRERLGGLLRYDYRAAG